MYWNGRVDGEELDVLRIHQVVKIMTLEELITVDFDEKKVCFVSFNSDEGVRRNSGRLGAKDGWIQVKKALSGFPIFKEDLKFYDLKFPIEVVGHDLESAHAELANIVTELKKRNFLVVLLGGGHDVAFANYSGILQYASEKSIAPKIGIINFDAHFG